MSLDVKQTERETVAFAFGKKRKLKGQDSGKTALYLRMKSEDLPFAIQLTRACGTTGIDGNFFYGFSEKA